MWPLYLALKQLFPAGKRFPFFTFISVAGVALGVAALIVSISVMGGFGREIRRMIVDTQGDVQVLARGPLADPDLIIDLVASVPGVVGVTPYAEGVVGLQYENKPAFPAIRGVDIERVNAVIPFDRYLRRGELQDLDDDSVILSSGLAASLGARVGGRVQVVSPLAFERLGGDEVMLPRELEIIGIFEVGHQALDSSSIVVTLRLMQELYGLEDDVHGLNLKLAPGLDVDVMVRQLNGLLPTVAPGAVARSWMEANQDFLFVIQLEKNMIFFLLTFIILVAAFSVTSSLLISVVRKTREIGLLSAMGGSSTQVACCFAFQALLVGIAGTALGCGLGFMALRFRNEAVGAFTRLTGSEEALLRFYEFSQLPAYLPNRDLATIITLAVAISALAGLIPAWRAARLKPVEALRSE